MAASRKDVMDQPDEREPADDSEDVAELISGWRAQLTKGRRAVETGRTRLEEWRQRLPLVDAGVRVFERDRSTAGTVLGSALAFRLFLFFIPMVLTVVGITGLLSGRIRPDSAVEAVGVSGTMSDQIRSALAQSQGTAWTALIIGFFGLLWAGRSLARVLLASAAIAWMIPVQRTKTTVRVIGAVVGLMAGMGVLMGVANRIRDATGTAIGGLSMIAVAGIYMVLWLLVLLTLPRQRSDPSSLIPGAVVVGATLGGMQAVTQLYLPSQLDRASDIYGTIGVATVTMGWFFFAGRVMVLANSLNAVIYEKFGSIAQFVFSLPVLRIIPKRWPRLGEFFGVRRLPATPDAPVQPSEEDPPTAG